MLFAERGYRGTGMKDIAAALNVQAPSLYNYVSSKQELLDLVYLQAAQGMGNAVRDGMALNSNVVTMVRRGMEEKVRWCVRHPSLLTVLWRETNELTPPVREQVLDLRARQRDTWREVVQQGLDAGVFSTPSAELAAFILHEMCSGLQVRHFSVELGRPESELVYLFGGMALNLLGRPADAT